MISDEDLDALIYKVSKIYEAAESLNFVNRQSKNLLALQELKQRRESDLCPAVKFLGATAEKQYEAIIAEIEEVGEALETYQNKVMSKFLKHEDCMKARNEAKSHILEELVDVQTACETMMAILGADETARNEVRQQVIEKNRRRGYYEGAASNK